MHKYRTNTCGELGVEDKGASVRLSGWIASKRDHGGMMFVDLRDHYGVTQCVIDMAHPGFPELEKLRVESVITIDGAVVLRAPETVNEALPTGRVEVKIATFDILAAADVLPILVNGTEEFPEDLRLKYRYIDLRRKKMQQSIALRSNVIKTIRDKMWDLGFNELQTPILTASSPEGARDFLVPSRQFPGRFYALPQAPQQFKQLAMVAGFDKYFQIAPCFRDEDGRADRVLEFYQLDLEMSFATEDDVLTVAEDIFRHVFTKFAGARRVDGFKRIPYAEAMEKYGSDKPDLRNPLVIEDVTDAFRGSGFAIFAGLIEKGAHVKAIPAPASAARPRSWFDGLNAWARANKMAGLGYITFEDGEAKGPIAKNLEPARIEAIRTACGLKEGDSVFFVCDKLVAAQKFAGAVRTKIGTDLGLIEQGVFRFAFIVDFPFYELDEATGKLDFAHNPFSTPHGGLAALHGTEEELLSLRAHQYDVVCNGFEMSSGAVRNTDIECAVKAFENVGYTRVEVMEKFSGLLEAFRFGVPPHAGMAPGIDRIVMLLADEPNLREVILFPPNGRGEDLMMGAPGTVSDRQLKELHIKLDLKKS